MVSSPSKKKNQESRASQVEYAQYLWGLIGDPKPPEFFDSFQSGDLPSYISQLRHICRENDIEFEEQPETPSRSNGYANGHSNGKSERDTRVIKTGRGYKILTPIDAIVDETIIHSDYRLLALLIDLAGKNGYLWHSEQSLATNSVGPGGKKGASIKTIERGLKRLATGNDMRGPYIEILSPMESKARGYNTFNSPTNTIIVNVTQRQE